MPAKNKRAQPVPEEPKKAAQPVKQERSALDGSGVVPLMGRRMDIVYAKLYFVLFAFALFTLYTDCGRILPPSAVSAVCPALATAQVPGGALLTGLNKEWQREHSLNYVKNATGASLSLLRADVGINLLLAPILGLIMLTGASHNKYQFLANTHGIVTALATICFLSADKESLPTRTLSRISLAFFAGVPFLLLRRWASEWPFSYKTLEGSRSFVSRFYNSLVSLAVLFWLIFSALQMYDWAVSSHKDLKTLPKVGPAVAHAQAVAVKYLEEMKAQEKADELLASAQVYAGVAQEKVRGLLADLGDAVRNAVNSATAK